MAKNVQILLETLTSGLVNQLQKLKDLTEELQGFQDVYSKDYKIVNDRIDNLNVQIDETIKELMPKIDNSSYVTDTDVGDIIAKYVKANIQNIDEEQLKTDLTKLINNDIGKLKSEILQTINEIKIPQGEKGEDGKSVTNDEIQNNVSTWIKNNKDILSVEIEAMLKKADILPEKISMLKKELNANIAKRISDLSKAINGIGIKDITRDKEEVVFTLTDGTEKRITLPKQQTKFLGGGGVSEQIATSVRIVSFDKDSNIEAFTQNILVDATSGDINLTLPNPAGCYIGNRSYIIGITRTDLTANVVNILSYNGELIFNDASQTLLANEVINLITDSTNWYYRS